MKKFLIYALLLYYDQKLKQTRTEIELSQSLNFIATVQVT